MIKITCLECGSASYRSPSKVTLRTFCDMKCYSKTRNRELNQEGRAHRFKKGRPEIPNRIAALKKVAGTSHYAWKAENVSYRGLHQWVRRLKGRPTQCLHCGKQSDKPRIIQWANVDGKYRRNLDDFIALCASCHKLYDLNR